LYTEAKNGLRERGEVEITTLWQSGMREREACRKNTSLGNERAGIKQAMASVEEKENRN